MEEIERCYSFILSRTPHEIFKILSQISHGPWEHLPRSYLGRSITPYSGKRLISDRSNSGRCRWDLQTGSLLTAYVKIITGVIFVHIPRYFTSISYAACAAPLTLLTSWDVWPPPLYSSYAIGNISRPLMLNWPYRWFLNLMAFY
jgi:hypothetical protein